MVAIGAQPARAETWRVGPGQTLDRPSAAAAVATAGDTVEIAPGTYYDCAVWTQRNLSLRGTGPGVVLSDTTCQGKAIWVIAGDDASVQGITFARARVPDGNGAGIRFEGRGLTIVDCQFSNDEVGVLAGGAAGAVAIKSTSFDRNKRALLIGPAETLEMVGTRIRGTRGGDAVTSSATRTTVRDSQISDTAEGAASCLLVAYGDLDIDHADFRKSTASARPDCVVLTGSLAGSVKITNSKLVADTTTTFVRTSSSVDPLMVGTTAEGDVTMHRGESARMMAGRVRRALGSAVGALRHAVRAVLEAGGAMR